MIVRNREQLLSHGNKRGRNVVLDLVEAAIIAIDPYEIVRKLVRIDGNRELIVGDLSYNLSGIRNIFVVGGGKATFPIAQALDEILGARIKRGAINVKKGEKRKLKHIRVREAGHPAPDKIGLEGAREIVEIADEAKETDLVFACITGGASALMPLPPHNISLQDKKKVTNLLLKCGAVIEEINAVRKHMSSIKGGRLAIRISPAEIISLIIMDEVPDLPWGPTVPDTTTFEDATCVLRKYDLWNKIPGSVRKHFEIGLVDSSLETPKPKDFEGLKAHNLILANNEIACKAAKKRAEELGLDSMILSTVLEGEGRDMGIVLAGIAKEIEKKSRPLKPPCVLIAGGEATVTITGDSVTHLQKGGPSQEVALGFSLKVAGSEKIVAACIDTDGTDGLTDVAGGIVDGYTMARANKKGIDIYKNLLSHNSSYVLKKLNDAVITGPTGTNVMDLNVIVVTA